MLDQLLKDIHALKASDKIILKIFLFCIPWLLIFFFYSFLRTFHFWAYEPLGLEDGLFENLEVILLFVSTILCFLIAKQIYKSKLRFEKFLASAYVLAALIFFIVFGEEISWGQRLLDLTTPESIGSVNVQKETNLHNINKVHYKLYLAYLGIGIYGAFAWIVSYLPKIKKYYQELTLLTPPYYMMPYFFPLAINMYFPKFKPQDFELAELILVFAIVIFLLRNLYRLKYK